jgi:putative membrane protein
MRNPLIVALAALALAAAAPAALAQAAAKGKLSKQDRQYFSSLAQANLAEVQAGKAAQDRAKSDEVKQFGEHMVEDHSKMLEEQQTLAKSKGVQLPKQPNKEQQAAMKKLQSAKGEQFDRAFMSQMVKDHEKALKLAQAAAKNAKDPQLKALAEKAAPEIEKHLQMAKQISDKASAGSSDTPRKKAR